MRDRATRLDAARRSAMPARAQPSLSHGRPGRAAAGGAGPPRPRAQRAHPLCSRSSCASSVSISPAAARSRRAWWSPTAPRWQRLLQRAVELLGQRAEVVAQVALDPAQHVAGVLADLEASRRRRSGGPPSSPPPAGARDPRRRSSLIVLPPSSRPAPIEIGLSRVRPTMRADAAEHQHADVAAAHAGERLVAQRPRLGLAHLHLPHRAERRRRPRSAGRAGPPRAGRRSASRPAGRASGPAASPRRSSPRPPPRPAAAPTSASCSQTRVGSPPSSISSSASAGDLAHAVAQVVVDVGVEVGDAVVEGVLPAGRALLERGRPGLRLGQLADQLLHAAPGCPGPPSRPAGCRRAGR